ncbi:mitochondrial PGP phosphatase [Aspergillus crustosus]
MNPPNSNLRAFNLAVQTLLTTPSQILPHLTIPTITHLPESIGPLLESQYPLTSAQSPEKNPKKEIAIRALVLDKDNTLCPAKTTSFPSHIYSHLHSLRHSPTSPFNIHTAPNSILIVSNRAGSHPRYEDEAVEIEERLAGLRIPVFRLPSIGGHGVGGVEKKPFCGEEVLEWFRERKVVQVADEIAVVGDRLGTDVLMAKEMGAWSIWCQDGVGEEITKGKRHVLEKMEVWVERYLRESKGLKAPPPRGYSQTRSD